MAKLGDRVRDQITGLVGVVYGYTKWKHNADTVVLKPVKLDRDGQPIDNLTLDDFQLEVIEENFINVIPCGEHKFKLDDEVKDKETGYKGVVYAVTEWVTGCIRLGVQSKGVEKKTGKTFDPLWLPETQAEMVKEKKVPKTTQTKRKPGGPMTCPPQHRC